MKSPEQYLQEIYPDITYIAETDTYIYRDFSFRSRMSGINFNTGECSYILVDKCYPYQWLFTYGNKEEMWNNFLEQKRLYIKADKKSRTWYEYIMEKLCLK